MYKETQRDRALTNPFCECMIMNMLLKGIVTDEDFYKGEICSAPDAGYCHA